MLRQCVGAHLQIEGGKAGHTYAGLDLAPGELKTNDKNSLCVRRSAVVLECGSWQDGDLDNVADRVLSRVLRYGVIRLFFDAVGVGGFATKTLKKLFTRKTVQCGVIPFMGGGKVYGGDYPFIKAGANSGAEYVILNKDFFKNAKSQQWWNIRLRAENTIKLLRGDEVRDPDYYLSFDPDIAGLDDILKELAQATYKEDTSGRIIIDKTGADYEVEIDGKKEKRRSPNDGDSVGYAYARDFQLRGLRANK
jgi:hypothetical protein